jgi:hypothetical protein
MYKLYNINKPTLPIAVSNNLVTLWEKLDNAELRYQTPVIVNERGEVVAGHMSAWAWAELKGFTIK